MGRSPTSSANRQNRSRLRKCAAWCGSWPRDLRPSARMANLPAASSVMLRVVLPGRRNSGSVNSARKTPRFSSRGISALVNA